MSEPQPPSRRRPRYRGTHPRRFDERYKELDPQAHPEVAEHVRAQGRTPAGTHVPVLVEEILAAIAPQPGEIVIDCTLGYGGHARRLLERIAPNGRLIGLDVDAEQLEKTASRLRGSEGDFPESVGPNPAVHTHACNFAGIGKILLMEGLDACDVIFADLGVSSMQLDDPARGFSYKHDGPLDLRMNRRRPLTAARLLNTLSREALAGAFAELADEPDAERLARRLVELRATRNLGTTRALVDLIFQIKGISPREWKDRATEDPGALHPAARVFQALRMLVSDELGSLREMLRQAPYCLRPGGRIGVISFHSGEDAIVETFFNEGLSSRLYETVSPAPIVPSREERRNNPRSASAKFRWARVRAHRLAAEFPPARE
ncbi:MAG: 16S rRNA (cytosine(1402)-N(4))-methyltransferase RsmH [Phycisphaerales bacterium]|nr:16S rRNA (cytosine(1402)-N(4))-methyltransferase RsmH [Phycisphaerales bacterium]